MKRERDEDTPQPPKKHPRRTLSEQIIVPRLQDVVTSPRSPHPERVNRALTDRIQNLKEQNANLKDDVIKVETENAGLQHRMTKDTRAYRIFRKESEQTREEMTSLRSRLTDIEAASETLRTEVTLLRGRVERAEQDAQDAKTELLVVRKGLTKELGEAVKKWGV